MSTLVNAVRRFVDTYFTSYPGYYDTMDAGVKDEHGYVKVLARDDNVIDAAVVGVSDKLKGQLPLGLVIARPGVDCPELEKELVKHVRDDLGAVAAFKLVTRVNGLPRTRSGKTARKTIADLADGKEIKIPPTIEDPTVYKEIKIPPTIEDP